MGWLDRVVAGGVVGYALGGPAGALAGVGYGAVGGDEGKGMRDVPFGVHVEADHEDDDVGRRWELRFLSELPPRSFASLRLVTDAGQRLRGHAPFVDDEGDFVAVGPIVARRCALYVPLGAVDHAAEANVSLEVSVHAEEPRGTPIGKAVLDADLPAPRPWQVGEYLGPLVSLCAHVMQAGDALEAMVGRLADATGIVSSAGAVASLLPHAVDPLGVDEAVRLVRFRFPGVPATEHRALLEEVCLEEGAATDARRARVDEVIARL